MLISFRIQQLFFRIANYDFERGNYPAVLAIGFCYLNMMKYERRAGKKTGRPRPDQIKFHDFLTKHRVIHGIARSPEDAVKIVKEGSVGYGFKDYGGKQ